jgi:hypothetical protein
VKTPRTVTVCPAASQPLIASASENAASSRCGERMRMFSEALLMSGWMRPLRKYTDQAAICAGTTDAARR